MRKILFFMLVSIISMASMAQHQCRVQFRLQNPPSTTHVWFIGDAWNTDSTQINVIEWLWSFGDGTSATGSNPDHEYQRAGTYLVCVTIATTDGCTAQFCDSINIGQNIPTCQAVITQQEGNNNDVYFNGYASNGNGGTIAVLSYQWQFGDGTGAPTQDPHHEYAHPGTYIVCLTILTVDSCISTTCDSVVIGSNTNTCAVNFSYQLNPGVLTVYFEANAWYPSGAPITVNNYAWNFGDGTSGTGVNPHHTYTANGVYRVCVEIHTSTGCVTYFCDSIQVSTNTQPNCIPTFTYYRDTTNSSVLLYYFMGYSGNNNYNTTRWVWSFGDGTWANTRDPHHVFPHAGWYQVCVYITDSIHQCYGHYCDSIHIGGTQPTPCQSAFTYYLHSQTGAVQFHGYDSNNPNYPMNITGYYWDFGDGSMSNSRDPHHTYFHPGVYYVCLTITTNNNCTSVFCDSIEIAINTPSICQANWSAYLNTNVNCPNCYTFVDLSSGNNIISRIWDFDDGTVSYNRQVVHSFNNPGMYHVCLTIYTSDSCISTYCNFVYVDSLGGGNNHCSVYLTYTTTPASSPSVADGAIDLTVHAGYPPYRIEWSTGAQTEDISALTPGYYTVEVHDSLNCRTHARIYVECVQDTLGIIIIDTLLNSAIDTCLNFQYQHVRVYNIRFINNTTVEVTWIFEGYGISDFITETYQVSQNGNYVVGIAVRCGTKTLETYFDVIRVEMPQGIGKTFDYGIIQLYPNPVREILNVNLSKEVTGSLFINVLNAFGQVVYENKLTTDNGFFRIPTNDFSPGLYIIKISTIDHFTLTAKFIK